MDIFDKADVLAQQGSVGSGDFRNAITLARQQKHLQSRHRLQVRAQQVQVLQQWHDQVGKAVVEEACAVLPPLMPLKQHIIAIPSPGGSILHVASTPSQAATTSIAWASKTRSTTMGQALEAEWLRQHKTQFQKPASHPSTSRSTSSCSLLGYCICTGQGKVLWKIRNCLLRWLKAIFNDKPLKAVLGSGKVVLRFVEPTTDTPSSSAANYADKEIFLHVSAMYWSPYRPIFCRLTRAEIPPGEAAHRQRIYLKAQGLLQPSSNHGDVYLFGTIVVPIQSFFSVFCPVLEKIMKGGHDLVWFLSLVGC